MLAAFKRPRYVAYVDEFPRTPTNKISKTQITMATLNGPISDLANDSELSPDDAAALLSNRL